ncbi:protein PRRC1-like [Elysia marginata]|uniref:Protein PRRC1-like n=1 Tax=Elysia marginata TaxID=1093978 RepID=A0AAV4HIY6_9GAST|nr:protein PRRC1-like [Elysia marginata]
MMEETEDQPEIVSHEEAVQAEKEAHERMSLSRESTPTKDQTPTVLAAPSPLPAFLSNASSSPKTPVLPTQSSHRSPQPVVTPALPPVSPQIAPEDRVKAPVTDQGSKAAVSVIPGQSLFGWFSGNSLVHKVVEKTKSSMESVITTLDPGMREIINSGGDINLAVTSAKDNKVVPVREAFQKVFGRATVTGYASQATTAAQPVGFTAGLKGAEERISNLKKSGEISSDLTVVSVEGFIVEILPDRWFEMSCLLLKDPSHGIEVQTFSQPTHIPTEYVLTAQDKTPSDYPLRWSGLAVTIGEVIETAKPHIGHADWQMVLSGVSRQESLKLAAHSLASIYKQKLPTSFVS